MIHLDALQLLPSRAQLAGSCRPAVPVRPARRRGVVAPWLAVVGTDPHACARDTLTYTSVRARTLTCTCILVKTLPPTQIACAPSPPAMRQCAPPRLAHSLHRTRLRPHSTIRIRTEHVSCELLAATHTHNTLHCTCTFLHSAHNKRVMIFLDTASTTHAPRASSRFSHALRASTALFCT